MSVVLINAFEVATGKEDEVIAFWDEANVFLKTQPGYISTRFHRALTPESRFKFVNVAQWESIEAYQAAVQNEDFQALAQKAVGLAEYFPGLYEVIRDDHI